MLSSQQDEIRETDKETTKCLEKTCYELKCIKSKIDNLFFPSRDHDVQKKLTTLQLFASRDFVPICGTLRFWLGLFSKPNQRQRKKCCRTKIFQSK